MPQALSFLQALSSRLLIADGAMGTLIMTSGRSFPFDPLNLSEPDFIASQHQAYKDAGAQVLYTNTFNSGPICAARQSETWNPEEGIASGVLAAKSVAKRGDQKAFVLGCIGPTGLKISEMAELPEALILQNFTRQLKAFIEADVDGIVFETLTLKREMELALKACEWVLSESQSRKMPLIVTVSATQAGSLSDGTPLAQWAGFLEAQDIDALGFNCGYGPVGMKPALQQLLSLTTKPLALKFSAGLPEKKENAWVWPLTPQDFADEMTSLLNEAQAHDRVRLVGGCCGTTPLHIRALSEAV